MEGHEEERGSCKIDTSVHERFRATRAVLRGRNDRVVPLGRTSWNNREACFTRAKMSKWKEVGN